MNYRDFYKKEQTLAGPTPLSEKINIENLPPRIRKGIEVELEHTPSRGKKIDEADPKDIAHALKVAKDHWAEDKNYYEKLTKAGLEECGDMKSYGGLTPLQPITALDVPSRIRPVSIVNLISPATAFGKPQSDPSQAVGSVADDKETITAAGKTDPSIAQKSVGGPVVPGGGQEKGGPNTKGNIAGTPKELSQKSECGGPNTKGSVGGTPKNPSLGLRGSDLIKGGLGVSTSQSHLGQFEEKEENEEVPLEEPETDSADAADAEDQRQSAEDLPSGEEDDEEGKDVTINLNESIKKMIKDVVLEVVQEVGKNKKWIQKAVDPKHKGYCTPMTKPTCTPRRKALAMRFKKGDLSEVGNVNLDVNKIRDIEVDGVDSADYPDFSDAYVVSAVYPIVDNPKGPNDWRELTDDELDWLNNEHPEVANQAAHGRMHDAGDFAADAAKDRAMGLEEVGTGEKETKYVIRRGMGSTYIVKAEGIWVDNGKYFRTSTPNALKVVPGVGNQYGFELYKPEEVFDTSQAARDAAMKMGAQVSGELEETAKMGPKGLGKKETPKFKDKPAPLKKPGTQTVSKLQKEAAFISRKINEHRQLTDDEKKVIKEIILSKAVRLSEELDDKGWEHAAEGRDAMFDSFIEDSVKYRSAEDTVEEIVDSIAIAAEDHLGMRHVDYDYVEQRVRELISKYPAKY